MAHVKTGGATKGNRDSIGRRLGVKVYGGSSVKCGSIIMRQRGSKFKPGIGVKLGRDFTIYAIKSGIVCFREKYGNTFIDVRE